MYQKEEFRKKQNKPTKPHSFLSYVPLSSCKGSTGQSGSRELRLNPQSSKFLAASPVHSIPNCPSLLIPQDSCSFCIQDAEAVAGRAAQTKLGKGRRALLFGDSAPLWSSSPKTCWRFSQLPCTNPLPARSIKTLLFNVLFPPTLHSPTLNAIQRCIKKIFTHIPASPPCQPKEQGLSLC